MQRSQKERTFLVSAISEDEDGGYVVRLREKPRVDPYDRRERWAEEDGWSPPKAGSFFLRPYLFRDPFVEVPLDPAEFERLGLFVGLEVRVNIEPVSRLRA